MNRISVPSPSNRAKFAVARVGPGITATVECDGFLTEPDAARYARQLNREQLLENDRLAILSAGPEHRRIIPGFYSDSMQ